MIKRKLIKAAEDITVFLLPATLFLWRPIDHAYDMAIEVIDLMEAVTGLFLDLGYTVPEDWEEMEVDADTIITGIQHGLMNIDANGEFYFTPEGIEALDTFLERKR